jgi:hypothetical protein
MFIDNTTQDKLAAAHIAKIFGSELLSIQDKATMDSGGKPSILKMHPKQFLFNEDSKSNATTANTQQSEQELLRALQREAEAAHPLPPSEIQTSQPTPDVQIEPKKQSVSSPITNAPIQTKQQTNTTQTQNPSKIDSSLIKEIRTFNSSLKSISRSFDQLVKIISSEKH